MAEKIEIFKLDIDIDAVTSKTSELKKESESLKRNLDALKKSGDTSSETYVQMKAAYDDVNKQYRTSQNELTKLINLQGKEIKTVTEARNALTVINKEWADQASLYGENSKAAQDLADKKLELTSRLKELESATGDNTRNVGNYTESIKDAFGNLNIFNGGLGDFAARMKETGGTAGTTFKRGIATATQSLIGLTKATLAFIATPIGALLAVLVGAFALIKNAMNRSEDATNKLSRVFSTFSGIMSALLKALEPVGEFLIDGIVKGFDLAAEAADKGIKIISSALSALGFSEASEAVANFGNQMSKAAKDAQTLAKAEAELEKSQRKARLIQLEYQKEAETFRQIRDDENKTIAERIKANEDLNKVLNKQLEEELNIAKQALLVSNLRIDSEGKTKENLDAQAEALTTIADIEERINGQRSEQLTNQVALQKEAADKAQEIADRAIKNQQEELELFIQQQGTRAKSLEEQLSIAQKVYQKEVEILEANLKNRNITQTKYDSELLRLKNQLLEKQAEVTVTNAKKELDEYIQQNQSKLDSDIYYSSESLRIEQERLNGIAEKRRDFEAQRLAEGVITEQQYNEAINTINEENRIALEEAQAEREEAKKEKEVADLENQRAIDEMAFKDQFDLESFRLEQQKQQELAAAEQTGASKTLIEKKYAKLQEDIEKRKQEAKLALAGDVFTGIADLLGKESKAGKAAALAAAVINTAQGVTKALSQGGILGVAMGAVVAATGAVNIAKIASAKTPKAEQGALFDVGGNRHYAGGTKFYGEDGSVFEAEQGELIGVMNRRAAMLFKGFNDEYRGNSTSSRNFLAGGGFVQTTSLSRGQAQTFSSNVDYDQMARSIGYEVSEANKLLPTPIVTVEDINYGQSSYAEVRNRADL